MRQLLVSIACVIIACGLSVSKTGVPQGTSVGDGWVRVSTCQISLLLPRDMKNQNVEGVDSCVAEFANSKMTLSIDYGWYGEAHKKDSSDLEFREQSILVGGKKAQLATYIDDSSHARDNPDRKYVAGIYIVVKRRESERIPMTTSLVVTVRGESKKEQETAKRIFDSVRF